MQVNSPDALALARRMLVHYGSYDAMRAAGRLVDGVWMVPLPEAALSSSPASSTDVAGLVADLRASLPALRASVFFHVATNIEKAIERLNQPSPPPTGSEREKIVSDGWIAHNGKGAPPATATVTAWRYRHGGEFHETRTVGSLCWHHYGEPGDIVAYKLAAGSEQ